MEPTRKPDRILDEWNAVANTARPPASAPRPSAARGVESVVGLVGAGLIAAAIVVAVGWLGGHSSGVGGNPSPSTAASQVAIVDSPSPSVASAEPSATSAPSVTPTPTATPTASEPTAPPATEPPASASPPSAPPSTPVPSRSRACDVHLLSARITAWEGAAGSRIARVSVRNDGSTQCDVGTTHRPLLLDGSGTVLARGAATKVATGPTLEIAPGETLTTLVAASNVCNSAPKPPITVAFDIIDGQRLEAAPLTPTDDTLPPCNGQGQPAAIQMRPWTR